MDLSDATVGQLLIPVEDLDRAIAFYRDTLGLRFLFSAPPQMSFFQTGNVRLLIGVPAPDQTSTAWIGGLLQGGGHSGRFPDPCGARRSIRREPPRGSSHSHD